MSRYITPSAAAAAVTVSTPLGGFVEAVAPGTGLKRVGTAVRRSDYPEMDTAFPFDGTSGQYYEFNRNTKLPSPSVNLFGTAYGASRFVVGTKEGKVLVSADGVGWSVHLTGLSVTQDVGAVCYGDNVFVVGNAAGEIATSPDGCTWTPRGVQVAKAVQGIGFGNGVFVASHWDGATAAITTSINGGVTWTTRAAPASTGRGIAYGNGAFVVAASSGTVWRSTDDGVTWSTRTAGGNGYGVAHSNGAFVLCGDNGIYRSVDVGLTWARVSSDIFSSTIPGRGVCADPASGWIAVGGSANDGCRIATSMDGVTWISRTTTQTDQANSIAVDGAGNFLIVGENAFQGSASTIHLSAAPYLFLNGVASETRFVRLK